MEQLNYNLLYRWFVGLSPDDPIWDPTTFTKNRDALVPLCQGVHDQRTSNSCSWPGETSGGTPATSTSSAANSSGWAMA